MDDAYTQKGCSMSGLFKFLSKEYTRSMIEFLHTYIPSRIAFQIGPLAVHWYGLCALVGALVMVLVVRYLARRGGFDLEKVQDFFFYAIVGAIVGARLYYVVYAWSYYSKNILDIFKIWEGGLAIHGALLGGFVVLVWYARQHAIKIREFLDILVVGVVAGQSIGRFGNYFNQELYGLPTDLPWGIPISPEYRRPGFEQVEYFHPTFLYEILLNVVVLAMLVLLTRYSKKLRLRPGFVAGVYFLGYGIVRFVTEMYRIDYSPIVFGVRWAHIASGILIFFSVIWLIHLDIQAIHAKKHKKA
jgi:phosphatidylglycerol:prolipoprotein diacylglycerol transferase